MALEGLHHITAITGDAPRNVDFYGRALGLRLVKKTVNFDRPEAYHLYYGDERGTPGSLLTFFEFAGAAPGRHGDGMPYRIAWRVAGDAALDFWSARLEGEGVPVTRVGDRPVHFADPEGLEHELVVDPAPDAPLVAAGGDIPTEHALLGLAGLRAYASNPRASAPLLDALGFAPGGDDTSWNLVGDERRARWSYDAAAAARGSQGAGSIHHVAWSAADDGELEHFRAIAAASGARPTPIIDRQYFHSVYFREPSGVLFELATRDIGFDVDEPLESLGAELKLPAQLEPDRARLERLLTPIANPRSGLAGPS
jgi:glyoxalase family protein